MLELIEYYADRFLEVFEEIKEALEGIADNLIDRDGITLTDYMSMIAWYLKEKSEADQGRQIIVIDAGGKNEREQKESE